jgi:hypothetical protein
MQVLQLVDEPEQVAQGDVQFRHADETISA